LIGAKLIIAVVLVSVVVIGLRVLRSRAVSDPLLMGLLEGWANVRGGKRVDSRSVAVPSIHGPIRIGAAGVHPESIGEQGQGGLTFRLLVALNDPMVAIATRKNMKGTHQAATVSAHVSKVAANLRRILRRYRGASGKQKKVRFVEQHAFYEATSSHPQRWKALLLDESICSELCGWSAFTIAVERTTPHDVRALPTGFYVFVILRLPVHTPTATQLDAGVSVVGRAAALLNASQ
jgi:hypothetical protein